MFRRYRASGKNARFVAILKGFLGLCLVGLIVLCALAKIYWGVAFIATFLTLLVFARRLDEWVIGRRFRKSPYHDEHVRIQLSTEGLTTTTTKSSAQHSWAVFTKACRLADGFLLFHVPDIFNWLPIRAITEGTAEEAEELIRANVADYKRASLKNEGQKG